jgi:protein TonB
VGAHLVVLAVILFATRERPEDAPPPPKPEEVTYVDVSQIPEPPEPEPEPEPAPAQPDPTPQPPSAAPRTPRVRPVTPKPNEVAGTQELQKPPIVSGIPDPDVAAPPVKAEDFGGRGAIGGTAAGTPPPTPPATTTGGGTGSSGDNATGGTYSSNMVDRRAELLNRQDVARKLVQFYPPLLRDAGITGTVSVQFVVTPQGRVEMSSVKILSSTHESFADATMRILKDLRFSPAKVGNTNVRMLTVMPVRWNLEQ